MDVAQESITRQIIDQQIIDASLEALLEEAFDPPTALSAISEEAPNEPPQTERRFARVPFRGRASAVICPSPLSNAGAYASEVLTTDISRGGLSLLHRRELHPGQRVILELCLTSCEVEVCWCSCVWPGLYVAGCRFIDAALTDVRETPAKEQCAREKRSSP